LTGNPQVRPLALRRSPPLREDIAVRELAIARTLCGVGFVFGTIYLTKMLADWFAGKELATAMVC
jgi:hypothetical protein